MILTLCLWCILMSVGTSHVSSSMKKHNTEMICIFDQNWYLSLFWLIVLLWFNIQPIKINQSLIFFSFKSPFSEGNCLASLTFRVGFCLCVTLLQTSVYVVWLLWTLQPTMEHCYKCAALLDLIITCFCMSLMTSAVLKSDMFLIWTGVTKVVIKACKGGLVTLEMFPFEQRNISYG